MLYHIPIFQPCRSRTLHSQSGCARISALAALPDYRVHTGMRVCIFAVALVHIDASTCMCNILQSIPTQLNNLAMQLQTSWGVGPLSSTIQCYMDLSRALYFLSCHGYGHVLAVRLISVPLQCGIAVLLSMEPTAHQDNDFLFCLGGQVFPRAVHRLHFSIS